MKAFTNSRQDRRVAGNRALIDAAEEIVFVMHDRGVNKHQLSEALGISHKRMERILTGDINLSIKQLSKIMFVMGCRLGFSCREL